MPDTVNIPLTPDESAILEEAARGSRLSLVQWIKIAALKAARPPSPGSEPAEPPRGSI